MINVFEKEWRLLVLSFVLILFLILGSILVSSYTSSTGQQTTSAFGGSLSSWWSNVKSTFGNVFGGSESSIDVLKEVKEKTSTTEQKIDTYHSQLNIINQDIDKLNQDIDDSEGWFGRDTAETERLKSQLELKEAEKEKIENLIETILEEYSTEGEEKSEGSSFFFGVKSLFGGGDILLTFDRLYSLTELFLVPAIIIFFIFKYLFKLFPKIPIFTSLLTKTMIIVQLILFGILVYFWGSLRGWGIIRWVSIFIKFLISIPYHLILLFMSKNSGTSLVAFVLALIIFVLIIWLISKNLDKIFGLIRKKKTQEEIEKDAENVLALRELGKKIMAK